MLRVRRAARRDATQPQTAFPYGLVEERRRDSADVVE
jgi:hypothetical protein